MSKKNQKTAMIAGYATGGVGVTLAIVFGILWGTKKTNPTPIPSDDVIAKFNFEATGDDTAKITGFELKKGKTLADVTLVTFPSDTKIKGKKYTITEIQPAILKGCSNIRTIETPFVGTQRNPEELTMEGRHLIGSLFGDELFDGATSLTYQDHWGPKVDEANDGELQHYLLPFAIPSSLREVAITTDSTIPVGAFSYCTHISHISIEADTTPVIQKYAFRGCHSLNELDKSDKVTTIEEHAFDDCTSLISFDFTGVTTIGDSAFASCIDMEPIYIPSSVTTVGSGAFTNFSHLIKCQSTTKPVDWQSDWADTDAAVMFGLDSPNAPTYVDEEAQFSFYIVTDASGENKGAYVFEYLGSVKDKEITIPYSLGSEEYPVTHIGSEALMQYIHTEKIVLECASVISIDSYAFCDCRELKTVQFGNGEDIKIDSFKSLTTIGSYAFALNSELVIDDTSGQTFPSSVTTVGDHAFYSCSKIKNVDLSNVTEIGASAFAECYHPADQTASESGLEKVTVKQGIVLGEKTFNNCQLLTSVVWTTSTEVNDEEIELPDYCFNNTNLKQFGATTTTVTIPSNVKSIGDYCFAGCENMTSVTVGIDSENYGHLQSIGDYAFYDCRKLSGTITVPALEKDAESKDVPTMLGVSTFEECQNLTGIEFKGALGSLPESVFHGCSELDHVEYTSNSPVESIGAYAFANCQSIHYLQSSTNSRIPATVRSVGDKAFMNCVNMGRPSGVEYLAFECDSTIWPNPSETPLQMGKDVFYGWYDSAEGTSAQYIRVGKRWLDSPSSPTKLYWNQGWTLTKPSSQYANYYITSETDAGEPLRVNILDN